MKASKDLERFLDSLKNAESQLEKHSYHEMAALSRKLAEVRQARRQNYEVR